MAHDRIPPHVAMSTEGWFDFRVGDRVMTVDGIAGTVTELLEGPTPGSETYIVVLDNGLGGGEYQVSDLQSMGSPTTAAAQHDAVVDVEGSFEALAEGHFASEDYPELTEIIVRRPPPKIVVGKTATKGHRLETASTNGGIIASCSCGEVYTPKAGNSTVWATWDRDKIKKAHREHVEAAGQPRIAVLARTWTEHGKEGERTHLTAEDLGTVPIEVVANLTGLNGETPGAHRNKHGEVWEAFKEDIRTNGILHPIFITIDWNDEPHISEGNHRRDAALEIGMAEVPVEVRYFGCAEKQGSLTDRPVKTASLHTAGARDTPAEVYGLTYDASLLEHPEVKRAQAYTGWSSLPLQEVQPDNLYAIEAMLASSSIDKVVSGAEPLRTGYDPHIVRLSDGREVVIDGHHRAAMATAMDRPMQAHVLDLSQTTAVLHVAGWQVVNTEGEILFGPVENRYSADNALDDLRADPENEGAGLYVQRAPSTDTDFHEGEGIGTTADPMPDGYTGSKVAGYDPDWDGKHRLEWLRRGKDRGGAAGRCTCGMWANLANNVLDSQKVQHIKDDFARHLEHESRTAFVSIRTGGFADMVDNLADKVRGDGKPGYAWSYDWCRFRRLRHCWYPKVADHEATKEAGYMVWVPEDRGICERDKWDAQKTCPIAQPGPHSGEPGALIDATIPWQEGGQHGGIPTTSALEDPDYVAARHEHLTASWADVRNKAVDIRTSGGVRVTSSNAPYYAGEVVGSNGVYHPEIMRNPGTAQIGTWWCDCPWTKFAWGRSTPYKHLEGRPCSHVFALQYELQSRGMFGNAIREGSLRRTAMPPIGANPTLDEVVNWYTKAAEEEDKRVTPVMQEVAKDEAGILEGVNFRRKEPERIKEKVKDRFGHGGDPRALISDALRYTMVFHPADYSWQVQKALYELESRGYKVTEQENSWVKGDSYSGLHYVLITPGGLRIELQFHTQESWELKDKTLHKMYKEFRDASTPLRRRQQLWMAMTHYWDDVEIPKDVLQFNGPPLKAYPMPGGGPMSGGGPMFASLAMRRAQPWATKTADVEVKVHNQITRIVAVVPGGFLMSNGKVVPANEVFYPTWDPSLGLRFSGSKQVEASGDDWADELLAKGGQVAVYRGCPVGVHEIRDGDWIALDEPYCALHAEGFAAQAGQPWHVISAQVPASTVEWAGEDADEWYGDSGEKREFFYRGPAVSGRETGLGAITGSLHIAGDDDAKQHGVMIALVPPESLSRLLIDTVAALNPDNEPQSLEQSHITLAYLGDEDGVDAERLERVISAFAYGTEPLAGRVSGLGAFQNYDGDVAVALWDIPGLDAWRTRLVEHLEDAGIEVYKDHSFTPHTTLSYGDAPPVLPAERLSDEALAETKFDSFAMVHGLKWTTFPCGDGEPTSAMTKAAMADRSGVPEVDALIEAFLKEPGIADLRDPANAHGMCAEVTEEFVRFARGRGFKAYVTDTNLEEMGYEVTGPAHGQVLNSNGEIVMGHYQDHTVASIYLPDRNWPIEVDFTASQYGYTDHPKVTATLNAWDSSTSDLDPTGWSTDRDEYVECDRCEGKGCEFCGESGKMLADDIRAVAANVWTENEMVDYFDRAPERCEHGKTVFFDPDSECYLHVDPTTRDISHWETCHGQALASRMASVRGYQCTNADGSWTGSLCGPHFRSAQARGENLSIVHPISTEDHGDGSHVFVCEACGKNIVRFDVKRFGSLDAAFEKIAGVDGEYQILRSTSGDYTHAGRGGTLNGLPISMCGTTVLVATGIAPWTNAMGALAQVTCPRCLISLRTKTATTQPGDESCPECGGTGWLPEFAGDERSLDPDDHLPCPYCVNGVKPKTGSKNPSMDMAFEAMVGSCTESPHTSMNTWKDTGQPLSTEDLEQIAREMGMTDADLLDARATQQKYYEDWLWRKTRKKRYDMWGTPDAPLKVDTRPFEGPRKPVLRLSDESLAESLEWADQVRDRSFDRQPVAAARTKTVGDVAYRVAFEDNEGRVYASVAGDVVGVLRWDFLAEPPVVIDMSVDETFRRRGIGTEMFNLAKENESQLVHSDVLTGDGRGFVQSFGAVDAPLDFSADMEARIQAALNEEPEPALPITTGDDDGLDHLEDPSGIRDQARDSVHTSDYEAPATTSLVEDLQASLSHLAPGGGGGGAERIQAHDQGNAEIAAMAARFLKEGMKVFSPAEQQALIEEGVGERAGNLDLLDLEGTHYSLDDEDLLL